MTPQIEKIHRLAHQMEQALQNGQPQMFCSLAQARMQAIGSLCGAPRPAGLDDLLREAAAQNRRWIAQALVWIESKKDEIDSIRRKRRGVGQMVGAYDCRPSAAGRYVTRRG